MMSKDGNQMLRSVGIAIGMLSLLETAMMNGGAEGLRSRHHRGGGGGGNGRHPENDVSRAMALHNFIVDDDASPSSRSLSSPRRQKDGAGVGDDSGEPSFYPGMRRNLTVQLGGAAYLPCRVVNAANNSVSWIRNRDSHILSVDRDTFIVDDRFASLHNRKQATWTLQIKYVQARDAGSYECQVSTVPKIMTVFNLAVVVPKVRIFGNRDIHVRSGSKVDIKCVISQAVEHPPYVVWYHNSELAVTSSRRFPTFEMVSDDMSIATYSIERAVKSDEGNYTCVPANLDAPSVRLHVVSGELSEPSIQGSGGAVPAASPASTLALVAAVLFQFAQR